MNSQGMAEHIEHFNPQRPLPIITYGLPYEDAIAQHLVTTLQRKRPYLLLSKTLNRETDVMNQLTARLLQTGAVEQIGSACSIRSHTPYKDLLPTLADMRAAEADSIIVVGGGSLVDAAKVLAFALANDGVDSHDALDGLVGNDGHDTSAQASAQNPKPSTIPYMCAPTTLSAGEYSTFGGATDDRSHRKRLFQDPSPDAGHRVIVLDPKLTLTAPLDVWLSTGMRAVDHCVETVCSANPVPEATEAALEGLRQLVPALLHTKDDAHNLDARLQAQLGAAQSMKGGVLYNVKLGASHGIGHQLGPRGVPHAETTCVLLPAVLKYNAHVNGAQQKLVLDALWAEPIVADVLQTSYGLEKDVADLGDAIDAIVRALGLPRALSHYGIGRDSLDDIAAASLTDWMCRTNPVPLETKEQIRDILEQCL